MLGIPCTTNSASKQKELICASSEVFYEHYSHFPTCTSIYILNGLVSEPPTPASQSPWAERKSSGGQSQIQQKTNQIHNRQRTKALALLCPGDLLLLQVQNARSCGAASLPTSFHRKQKQGKSKSKAVAKQKQKQTETENRRE